MAASAGLDEHRPGLHPRGGSAWHPEYVSHRFATLIQEASVPKIRVHDLRRTHASMALANLSATTLVTALHTD